MDANRSGFVRIASMAIVSTSILVAAEAWAQTGGIRGKVVNQHGEPVEGGRSAGSLAWAGIFNTYFWVDPTQDTCGVLMTQVLPFYDAKVVELLNQFERAVYSHANR